MNGPQRFVLGVVLALVVAGAGLAISVAGGGQTDVLLSSTTSPRESTLRGIGPDSTVDDDSPADSGGDDLDAAIGSSPPTTTPPTSIAESTVTDSQPTPSMPVVDPALDVLVVGTLINGDELVRLVTPDEDAECVSGLLAYRSGDAIVRVYDDLGPTYHLTLENGPYSQVALVENCEESTMGMLFADVSAANAAATPTFVRTTLPAEIFHLASYGWLALTGLFSADVVYYDGFLGWNDSVVIDPFDGSINPLHDALGRRVSVAGEGVDLVVPTDWETVNGDGSLRADDPESGSSLVVEVHVDGAVDTPEPVAEEAAAVLRRPVLDLWEELDGDRSRIVGTVEAVDYEFVGPDGVRIVRVIVHDARTVLVTVFIDAGLGAATQDIPALAFDTVRVFAAVG